MRSPFIPDDFDVHIRTQECAVGIYRQMQVVEDRRVGMVGDHHTFG